MRPNKLVLGFDTSLAHCGAALFSGTDVIAAKYEDMAKGQAERLMPMLEEVLAEASAKWADLTALGVGIGPGNFTGIRISVSAARGLSLSLGIPAVGVSLLEALAEGAGAPTLSVLDAHRDALYLQGFNGAEPIAPTLADLNNLDPKLAQPNLTCIGPRPHASAVAERLGAIHAPAAFAPASAVARIAARRCDDNPSRPAPLYIRPADAAPSKSPAPTILP